MSALVAEGYARAQALTRRHSKSFYFSSLALWGARRRAAFALYAFCRRLDDLVDGDNDGAGTVGRAADALPARLELARASVAAMYSSGPVHGSLLQVDEHAAFCDTVERFRIPQQPFQDLINGMEMDLTKSRYANFDELKLYCYRAAGVVGLMMTHILGFNDEVCLPYAVDLGIAMQLTNVLRDVKEDWQRGRLYLPADELHAFGLGERDIAAFSMGGPHDAAAWVSWRRFMAFQIARARAFDERSHLGIANLTGFGSRRVVRLMSAVYGGILGAIERQGDDVFAARARVPLLGKLGIACKVMLTSNRVTASHFEMPSLPRGTP